MDQWFQNNWDNVVSVLGLIMTLYVMFISKKAEQAAKEAKQAIERKNVSQDLRSCSDDLNLLTLLCDNKRWELASFICNRLLQNLTFITHRWALHFNSDNIEGLNLLIVQLDTMNSQLRKFTTRLPKQTEIDALSSAMQYINILLTGITGKYESIVETGNNGDIS